MKEEVVTFILAMFCYVQSGNTGFVVGTKELDSKIRYMWQCKWGDTYENAMVKSYFPHEI